MDWGLLGRKRTWRGYLGMALGCLLLFVLLGMGRVQQQREALAERVAPAVLRFHILADSDSDVDQQVKLEVRSLILDYLARHMEEAFSPGGKAEAVRFLDLHREEIEDTADRYLAARGFSYRAKLSLTNCYFPTRVYGSLVFPCGNYDAARVVLGSGQGHNWWCVLYPRFCFVDAACREVPRESWEELQESLNQGDFLALEDRRPDIKIRFRFLPVFSAPKPADGGAAASDKVARCPADGRTACYSTAARPVTPQS